MAEVDEYSSELPKELWIKIGDAFKNIDKISIYTNKIVFEIFTLTEVAKLYPEFCAVCKKKGWSVSKKFKASHYPIIVEIRIMTYGQCGIRVGKFWLNVKGNGNCITGGNLKGKRKRRSNCFALQFPVKSMHRLLYKGNYSECIDATVYLCAVIEYLTADLLELSGNIASEKNNTRITPRHIQLAISKDVEFNNLLSSVIIPRRAGLSNSDTK